MIKLNNKQQEEALDLISDIIANELVTFDMHDRAVALMKELDGD